jgi:uncharacterized paraquat-inducible protein A
MSPNRLPPDTGPPRAQKKKTRSCKTALSSPETTSQYPCESCLQRSLRRRLNRVAAVSEVMPRLLAGILLQSFGLGGGGDDAD